MQSNAWRTPGAKLLINMGLVRNRNVEAQEKEHAALVSMANRAKGFDIVQKAYEQFDTAQKLARSEDQPIVLIAKKHYEQTLQQYESAFGQN